MSRCNVLWIISICDSLHQAKNRNGAAQQKSYREAPSVLRDEICSKLWEAVCANEKDRIRIEKDMIDARDKRSAEVV